MFDKVKEFETQIAKFYGAPFAVATDCCTHAIELCIRYTDTKSVTCPVQTYISVPFTLDKLNIKWSWEEKNWTDFYYIGNTNIIDAAVYWKENSYINNTFMCLSFQFKKHLSLGRGGMILCNNEEDYLELKKLSYDGRLPNIPWADQNINSIDKWWQRDELQKKRIYFSQAFAQKHNSHQIYEILNQINEK